MLKIKFFKYIYIYIYYFNIYIYYFHILKVEIISKNNLYHIWEILYNILEIILK